MWLTSGLLLLLGMLGYGIFVLCMLDWHGFEPESPGVFYLSHVDGF